MAEEYIEDGFVLLSRKIFSSKTFNGLNAIQKYITIHLILKANWKDSEWWDGYKKQFITIKRGSFITSTEQIRKEIKDRSVTTQKIRTCVDILKNMQFLTSETTSHYTLITILKYDLYQDIDNYINKPSNKALTKPQQSLNKALTTTKNVKKDKNDKKKRERAPTVFMTEEEYQKLITELGDPLTKRYIEKLSLYQQSKGKRYKSHYATILNWYKKDLDEGKVKKPADDESQPKHIAKPQREFTPEEIAKNKANAKKLSDMLKGKFDMPEMVKGG